MADAPIQSAVPPQTQETGARAQVRLRRPRRAAALLPPLIGALFCTAMIGEAIVVVLTSQDNGDMLVVVCPILGAIFLSIPAAQAWMACYKIVRGR